MAIDSSGKIGYIYNSSNDTWYALTGVANPNASYTWTGTQTYNNTAIFSEALIAKKGINVFSNATARSTALGALSSLNNGAISFITENNRLDYYSNGQWQILGSVEIVRTLTGSHTVELADLGKIISMNVSTANTLTIPLDTTVNFPVGSTIEILQYGAGQTTIAGTVGVTVRSVNSNKKISARYGIAKLMKLATNDWLITGDLSA
jgi:hypothetical protein